MGCCTIDHRFTQALDHGPGGGLLVGLEARMLHAVWAVYKKEYALSGRSELQYGACVASIE